MTNLSPYLYCPFFCEENIWHLAQAPDLVDGEAMVALITNADQACLFWDQRACTTPNQPIVWDYHVVLFVRREAWWVYDLDTNLPFPVDAATYLRHTFRGEANIPKSLQPRFVLFELDDYVKTFASDRSHMQDDTGEWMLNPPNWPRINPENSGSFIEFLSQHFEADSQLSLSALRATIHIDEA